MSHTTLAWAACLALMFATGCGSDTDFGGKSESSANSTPNPKNPNGKKPVEPDGGHDPSLDPLASLTWFWQCTAAPGTEPTPAADEAVVENEGPHNFYRENLTGTPVTFKGHLCPPAQAARDIIFVIDVSGSMGGSENNDPRIGNSCGRLSAVQSVIAATPPGQARFGIVTFGTGLMKTSSALFETQDQLFANVAPVGSIADVLCAANGSTYYDDGLKQAAALLKAGRPDASKEIYLVSDGQPSFGHDGIFDAQTLKTVGVNVGTSFLPVTIATVMLAGVDTVLEQSIASRDVNGLPLHAYVAKTGELTKALTALATNAIVSAALQYRSIGATAYTTLDLMAYLQGYDFTLPSFTIDMSDGAPGIEVLYEYKDQRGHSVSTGGKILWNAAGGG